MRKRKQRITIVLMLLVSIILVSCGKSKQNERKEIQEYCSSYAEKYEILEKAEDTVILVNVEAPDFKKIAEVMIKDKKEMTSENLEKTARKYPKYQKEYQFLVDENEIEEIKEKFLQETSKNLIIEAIKNTNCTEEWDTKNETDN